MNRASLSIHQRWWVGIIACAMLFGALAAPYSASAGVQEEIAARTRQIEELERQVAEFQRQAGEAGSQSRTLQNEVAKLNAQIGQLNAQIRGLRTSIERTDLEIGETERQAKDAARKMILHQDALAQSLRATDQADRQPLALVVLQHDELSDFYDYLHSIQQTQDNLRLTIRSIRDLREDLEEYRDDLEGKRTDLERLKGLQEIQQNQLATTKNSKDRVLKVTKGQEAKFQELVKKGQRDLASLREQISFLLQGGLTVEDAVRFAQLAAIGAGIRPAFLLALLEVESRLGRNVGTGNWRDDMYLCYLRLADIAKTADRKQYFRNRAENEKAAFFSVVGKLGLNPDTVKVSREPTYGCGGAMGPAQFIPTTWLGYEQEVMRLTGHNPVNPWSFHDAFTASAIKLARGGATSKDQVGETRAAKAYISGNPSCATVTCNNYAATILKKAADIERDL
jgi:membrane-bound lytic murein transglycosylase B